MNCIVDSVLVLIKPDAVKVSKQIISEFEQKGFFVLKKRKLVPELDLIKKHYEEHKDKTFYNDLCAFMVSGKIMALQLDSPTGNAVKIARSMLPDLRSKYGTDFRRNAVHVSDSNEASERELKIWFP